MLGSFVGRNDMQLIMLCDSSNTFCWSTSNTCELLHKITSEVSQNFHSSQTVQNCWILCKQIENTRYNHKHKYFHTSRGRMVEVINSNLCTCHCISSGETGTEIQSLISTQFTLKSLTDLHGLLWIVWAHRIQFSLLLCKVEIYEMDLIVVSVRALRQIMITWYQAFAKHSQRQNRKPPWNSPPH